jgi:putative ABC transport system substrate-binding protein
MRTGPSTLLRTGCRHEATGNSKKAKVFGFIFCALLFAPDFLFAAQQPPKIPRVGYISGTGDASNQGPYVEALRQGLRDLGHVEGKTFAIEYRGAEGKLDHIPTLVNELVQLKVDVLVVPILSAARAAKQASRTIPIVFVMGDPVAAGIVDSLAQPGGNLTGLATLNPNLSGKRLELLTEVVQPLSRIGVLRHMEDPSGTFEEYKASARALNIQFQALDVSGSKPDLQGAIHAAVKGRVNALAIVTSAPLLLERKLIADFAMKHRLPSIYQGRAWVESGGLMSYSTDDLAIYRRVAVFVDKILKGAKPADLPIEQPTKFEFVINLKTAKQIGLTIPQKVLVRADRVIK